MSKRKQVKRAAPVQRTLVRHQCVGTPLGYTYPEASPGGKRGPLDGQPAHSWEVEFHYSDGTVLTRQQLLDQYKHISLA